MSADMAREVSGTSACVHQPHSDQIITGIAHHQESSSPKQSSHKIYTRKQSETITCLDVLELLFCLLTAQGPREMRRGDLLGPVSEALHLCVKGLLLCPSCIEAVLHGLQTMSSQNHDIKKVIDFTEKPSTLM